MRSVCLKLGERFQSRTHHKQLRNRQLSYWEEEQLGASVLGRVIKPRQLAGCGFWMHPLLCSSFSPLCLFFPTPAFSSPLWRPSSILSPSPASIYGGPSHRSDRVAPAVRCETVGRFPPGNVPCYARTCPALRMGVFQPYYTDWKPTCVDIFWTPHARKHENIEN